MAETNPVADAANAAADDMLGSTDPLSGINLDALIDDDTDTEAAAPAAQVKEEAPAKEPEPTKEEASPAAEAKPDATPAPVPAALPAKPTPVAADPAPDPAVAAFNDRLAKYEDDKVVLKSKIDSKKYDPMEDGAEAARLALEGQELLELRVGLMQGVVEARNKEEAQASEHATAWGQWGKDHADVGGAERGQAILQEEYDKALAKGFSSEVAHGIAVDRLGDRVVLIRAQQAAKKKDEPAPTKKPSASPVGTGKGPTQVIPRSGSPRMVPQVGADDEMAEFVQKFGGAAAEFNPGG